MACKGLYVWPSIVKRDAKTVLKKDGWYKIDHWKSVDIFGKYIPDIIRILNFKLTERISYCSPMQFDLKLLQRTYFNLMKLNYDEGTSNSLNKIAWNL